MAWTTKKGINLRQTLAYVTDPSGTVCLPDDGGSSNVPLYTPGAHSNSPLSLGGDSFNCGWTSNTDGARNRSTTVNPRLAGRQGPTSGTNTLEVQAGASAGVFKIWLGITDQGNGGAGGSITFSDANGTLSTITVPVFGSANVVDANGILYANDVAWGATADGTGTSLQVTSTDTSNGLGGPLFKWLCAAGTPLASVSIQQLLLTIQQQPTSVVINSGDSAWLQIVVNWVTGSRTYQWQDNRSGSFANVIDGAGGTSQTYQTPSLTTGATGRQYRCLVSDTSGSLTSSSATITVLATFNTTIADFDPDLTVRSWFG